MKMKQLSVTDYSETYDIDGKIITAKRAYWRDDTIAEITLTDEDDEIIVTGEFDMNGGDFDPESGDGLEEHTDWDAYEAYILEIYKDHLDEQTKADILARIKGARERAGVTQTQLSDKLGIDQRQISRWETSRVPDVITLMQIARALDTTVSYLIGESD